ESDLGQNSRQPSGAQVMQEPPAGASNDAQPRNVEPVVPALTDKGNLRILRGLDGKLKNAVTLDVACRFGGVTRRAIEKALKKGPLQAEGDRQNRRVLVDSLLKYFPPENNAN